MYIKKSMCLSMKDCMNVGIMSKSNGVFFSSSKEALFSKFRLRCNKFLRSLKRRGLSALLGENHNMPISGWCKDLTEARDCFGSFYVHASNGSI